MRHDYADIRSLTREPPRWFDEYGVPRYVDFGPGKLANIYAKEGVLAEIQCQSCERIFLVSFSAATYRGDALSAAIVANTLDYGDPPNVGCCPAGPCMCSVARRVLQYWAKGGVTPPNMAPLLDRLAKDARTVLQRSREPWAEQYAADLTAARGVVQRLLALPDGSPQAPVREAGSLWHRHPIFEVPIYPDWVVR